MESTEPRSTLCGHWEISWWPTRSGLWRWANPVLLFSFPWAIVFSPFLFLASVGFSGSPTKAKTCKKSTKVTVNLPRPLTSSKIRPYQIKTTNDLPLSFIRLNVNKKENTANCKSLFETIFDWWSVPPTNLLLIATTRTLIETVVFCVDFDWNGMVSDASQSCP